MIIDKPNIVYTWHDYYSYPNTYPPSWQTWARAYWDGNFAQAKIYLEQKILTQLSVLINAGLPIVWDEGGSHYLNPHADVYLQDWYDLCDKYNIGFSTAFLEPYPREQSGILNSDCKTLNYMGQIWAANMP